MNLRTIVAAVLIGTALPAPALANNQAAFYTEEQILGYDFAGARVGASVTEIGTALEANGYTKDEDDLFGATMSRWTNEEQGRSVSTSDFVDVDGVRKSYSIAYTTTIDPDVPVSAIIKNVTERYGEPSRRLERGMVWLIDARQNDFDSRPMLSVEQRDANSLTFTLRHFGAQDAAREAELKVEMERMETERQKQEQASADAAANLDLGL